MATPAAVLSILVKAQGAQAAATQLTAVDKAGARAGSSLKTTEKHARKTSGAMTALGTAAKSAGVLVGAAGLAAGIKTAVGEFREAQKVGAQTNAVLKSTGNAAKVTKKHIEDLAGAISAKTGIDDEQIQSSENMLLTFTKVRNEAGKGNKIFDEATRVVTDMSVALGQSGKSSAIQLGKALNDPIKGITALRRVGVSFTADQQKQIETLVKSGDVLGAQKLILKELKTEFQGSAAAQATAGDKLKVALGNLAEAAGGILVPALDKAAVAMTKVVNDFVAGQGIAKFIIPVFNEIKRSVEDLVAIIVPLVQTYGPQFVAFWQGLPTPVKAVTAAFAALGVILAVSSPLMAGIIAFAAAAVLIKRNWGSISPVIQHVKDAISGWVEKNRGDINAILDLFRKVGDVAKAVFQVAFPVYVAAVKRQMDAMKTAISGAIQVIKGIFDVFLGALRGDWSRVWQGLKDIAVGGLKVAYGAVKTATAPFREIGSRITSAIIDGLAGLGHMILQRFKEAAEFVKDKIQGLFSGIGGLISKGVGKIPGIGDGIGKAVAGVGKGSANLMGARGTLAPFANIGAANGLHVSSGIRPGSITSSGNVSYHSSGEAIDMAGSPGGMLNTFRTLKARFGSRLAELIYTPGGVGIKDGKPFTYTGQVAQDHYDHVHVAFDTGRPGVGDGIGKRLRGHLMGDGYGKTGLMSLWQRAGGPASAANIAAAVALAESGGKSTATHRNDNGTIDRGLWQINSVHGAMSTLNPLANARAAVKISSRGKNWSPWVTYNTGAYKKFLGKAAAKAKKAAKKGASNVKTSGKAHTVQSKIAGPMSEAAAQAMNDQRLLQLDRDAQVQANAIQEANRAAGLDENGNAIDGGTDDNTAAMDALTKQLEETNRILDLQRQIGADLLRKYNISQTDYGTLAKAIADVTSGQIGGRVGLGFMTPGFSGGGSRY